MVAVEAQAAGLPVLASESVPAECTVLEDLVTFLSLDKTARQWAEQLNLMLEADHDCSRGDDAKWVTSGYNIQVSAEQLGRLYCHGN